MKPQRVSLTDRVVWSYVAVAVAVFLVRAVAAPPPTPIELNDLPLLFADNASLAVQSRVVRTIHPARTRPAPVLVSDRPWEGSRVYVYGSVERDDVTGELRLWYMSRAARAVGTNRTPSLRTNGYDLTLYATSRDGVSFVKPALGLHSFDGSDANNIVFDLHSPSVLHDQRDPDPARRYKMLGYRSGGYHSATSPDGLHWTPDSSKNGVLTHSDTITLAQDPRTGEYLAYHKRPDPKGRSVWLARSRDFIVWSEPERVFGADESDDAWVAAPDQRTEVYNMSVLSHAGGFLGFPAMFRRMRVLAKNEVAAEQSSHDGPLDIQLATSADGRAWRRTVPRLAIIPRGAPGTFDGGAMLGVSNSAVHTESETWMYYTAITTGHGGTIPLKQLTIGRAEWRRHGFASLDADPEGGRIETRLLRFERASLVINADASRGLLRVALLEADGSQIPDRALADCEPLRADSTRWHCHWKNGDGVPIDRPVRLVIEFSSARLFSVEAGR